MHVWSSALTSTARVPAGAAQGRAEGVQGGRREEQGSETAARGERTFGFRRVVALRQGKLVAAEQARVLHCVRMLHRWAGRRMCRHLLAHPSPTPRPGTPTPITGRASRSAGSSP